MKSDIKRPIIKIFGGECRVCGKEFRGKTKQEVIDKCVAHKCKVVEAFRIRESLTPKERKAMDKMMIHV